MHPGIEVPHRSSDHERRARRRELGVPDGHALVGMVGRIEPGKNHSRFLDAVVELRRRGLNVHGLIVGGPLPGSPPTLMSELIGDVEKRGLADHVTLMGQVDDALSLIELMDVLVSVATTESFGIALVEAMALGVPVVAVDSGGPQEIIEPGRSGLLIHPSSFEDLVDAVARTLTDGDVRRQLIAGERECFLSRFTSARMTRELEAALTELCAA